jgi:hypothetical protein
MVKDTHKAQIYLSDYSPSKRLNKNRQPDVMLLVTLAKCLIQKEIKNDNQDLDS